MAAPLLAFADFELDRSRFELRRGGRSLKLEKIPLELLILLVERNGQLVSRQEIIDRLWGRDVFLDTEHGINTAIRKIRLVLRDNTEEPRFIQTVTGKGYRFIGQQLAAAQVQSPGESVGVGEGERAAISVDAAAGRSDLSPPVTEQKSEDPKWRKTAALALFFIIATALGAAAYLRWRQMRVGVSSSPGQVMMAVLPFENLSGDPSEDYFSDGLTEEMITQLGTLSPNQLGVIARTTSMAYKHTSKSVQQIGQELGVDFVLESSVRRDGDRLRISAQLIRTHDQLHIWAHNYDRHVSHSIALQEEVARAVAEQVQVRLNPTNDGWGNLPPLNVEANEAYLRGRYFWNQFTPDGYKKAIAYFHQAIERDPNFAEAYSGLADSYHFLYIADAVPFRESGPKESDAAARAVGLGDSLAEAHNSLAHSMFGRWDWFGAEIEFQRALALNPSYSPAHRLYAAALGAQRRHQEAWEQINQAMRTDPLSLPNNAEMVRTLYYARDYDRAIEQGQKALQLDADFYRTHFWLARVYAQKHMYAQAVAESEKVMKAMPDSNLGLTEQAYSLGVAGRQAEAREVLKRLEERSNYVFVPAYNLAIIHIALNDNEAALQYLQKSYEEHDWALVVLAVEPRLDPVRSDPRFQELAAKLKLPWAAE